MHMSTATKPIHFPLPLACRVNEKRRTKYRPRFRMEFGQEQDREEWLEANEQYFLKRAESRIGNPVKSLEEEGNE